MIETGKILNDRYKIIDLIAKGGMGAVYRAKDLKLGESLVAVKQTFVGKNQQQMAKILEQEAFLLANLLHPALPQVRDLFFNDHGHFLVMQYVEGEDLDEILSRQGKLPVSEVIDWTNQILDVLDYLHTHNPPIIHRDIKPANLKLTPRGHLMLLDFGLAKSSTNVSVRAYTLIYAAPEQITGHGTVPTSDIYSVGATLYHLLSGKEPVDATTRAITKVNGDDPMKTLCEIEKTIPQSLSELVSKAMELDARKRFLSVGEMRVQFKKVTQELWASHGIKIKGMITNPTINAPIQVVEDKKQPANKYSNIKIRSLFTTNLGLELVLIPSGSFLMGAENSGSDEKPVHEVKISQSFYLSQYLITQSQWEEIMGSNPSYFKGDKRLPVEKVSWIDVQEFIKRMNSLGDGTYRLPSEAEWEYACRAGSIGDYAGDLSELGWYADNSGDVLIDAAAVYKEADLTLDERYKKLLSIRCRTHVVGSKKPNKWKLYDMHGNVSEWCEDWYDGDYYKTSSNVNPKGPTSGSFRVVRGGSWFSLAEDCRSADRSRFLPTNRSSIVGFRLVREVE